MLDCQTVSSLNKMQSAKMLRVLLQHKGPRDTVLDKSYDNLFVQRV